MEQDTKQEELSPEEIKRIKDEEYDKVMQQVSMNEDPQEGLVCDGCQ